VVVFAVFPVNNFWRRVNHTQPPFRSIILSRFLVLTLILSCLHGRSQELHRLQIHPIDLDMETDYFPHVIHQVENVGEEIFIRGKKDPRIFVINRTGKILRTIGKKGHGPGEFSQGVLAMGIWGEQIFAMDVNQRELLLWFSNGAYQNQFKVNSSNSVPFGMNSNTFGVSDEFVVFPVSPRTGHLAAAYTYSGERVAEVGKIQFDKSDADLLEKIPDMNNTNWVYQAPYWYCLFKQFPLIHKYNERFELISGISLEHPRISQRFEEILDFDPARFSTAPPLFFDFKVKNGYLYATMRSTLIQVNIEKETIENMYSFFGRGEGFKGTSQLTIHHFTIMDDGLMILSGDFAWGHDLWKAPLPSFK